MRGIVAALLAGVAAAAAMADARNPARRLARVLRAETAPDRGGRRPPPGNRPYSGSRAPAGIRRPSPRNRAPAVAGPVVLDLVAAVLRAGAPVATSLRVVGECLAAHTGVDGPGLGTVAQRHELALADRTPGVPSWVALLDETLLLARNAGLAPGPLLTAAAEDERRRLAAARRAAASELGVRVVLPTGLCLLPAFVLLAVVPLVLALLGVG